MNTLELNGKKYKLVEIEEEPKRKTGYERKLNDIYYTDSSGQVVTMVDRNFSGDKQVYGFANYYSDHKLAADNARADALMRNLRRFSAEGRKRKIDKMDTNQCKYYLSYGFCRNSSEDIYVGSCYEVITQGAVYFDTKELAKAAIEKYRDELMWYFTQYQDTAAFREDVQADEAMD